jgi:hypothetical protein
MGVAILALEAGQLIVKNDARRHVLFMGTPLARPNFLPLVGKWAVLDRARERGPGQFSIEHENEGQVTWLRLFATFERIPGPASYVFPVERSRPSLLWCVWSTTCPQQNSITCT